MSTALKLICIVFAALCLACVVSASPPRTEAQRNAMERTVLHHLELFDRMDVVGWKTDLSPSGFVEGLGEKFMVQELQRYFNKLDAASLKSTITAPISISDDHAVFARTLQGITNNGCTFERRNLVTLVRFDRRQKVIEWKDMWEDLGSDLKCQKTEL